MVRSSESSKESHILTIYLLAQYQRWGWFRQEPRCQARKMLSLDWLTTKFNLFLQKKFFIIQSFFPSSGDYSSSNCIIEFRRIPDVLQLVSDLEGKECARCINSRNVTCTDQKLDKKQLKNFPCKCQSICIINLRYQYYTHLISFAPYKCTLRIEIINFQVFSSKKDES